MASSWQAIGQGNEADWATWLSSRSSLALASLHGGPSKTVRPDVLFQSWPGACLLLSIG